MISLTCLGIDGQPAVTDFARPEKAQEAPMTVWIYVDTSKQAGDKDHLKVFATEVAAEIWFKENDPEGVAFKYEVLK